MNAPGEARARLADLERVEHARPPAPPPNSVASSGRSNCSQALAGSRRKLARNSSSVRSLSSSSAARALVRRLHLRLLSPGRSAGPSTPSRRRQDRQEHQDVERDQHRPDDARRRDRCHVAVVALRHHDRERGGRERPDERGHGVGREHAGVVGLGFAPGEPRREPVARAAAQPGLAHQVDEDVVAVAVEQRVQVEDRARVGGEGELEPDVLDRPRPARRR